MNRKGAKAGKAKKATAKTRASKRAATGAAGFKLPKDVAKSLRQAARSLEKIANS